MFGFVNFVVLTFFFLLMVIPEQRPIGNNLSGLKAYFSQLNNLTSFGSIDHDEDQDESYHR